MMFSSVEKDVKKQVIICYLALFFSGMLALSLGSLLPFLKEAKNLDYTFCGIIISLHSVGNVISGFASGMLPKWLGKKRTILLFNSAFALSFLILIIGGNRLWIAVAFFLTGLSRGASSNFANAVILNIAPGKAGIVNGLHAMFSIGAFLFPLILLFITSTPSGNWIYACYFMMAMGILNWILYYMMPMPSELVQVDEKHSEMSHKKGADYLFLKEPAFYLVVGILFFYLCAEQGVIGWLITYFQESGYLSKEISQFMVSILWVMILAGRLSAAFVSSKMDKFKMLLIMSVGFVFFFILIAMSKDTLWIVIGTLGFGFSMAGIYPTTLACVGEMIQKYRLMWSYILTMASFGSILMPIIIGRVAKSAGIIYGMSTVVFAVAIDMILIIIFIKYMKKGEKNGC